MKKKVSKTFPDNIFRFRGQLKSREKFLRLDKNEKTSKIHNSILNYLKKNINSFLITGYPELEKLYINLSKYLKLKKENIILTGGADLAIKNCFELFVKPKDKIITIDPTFAMVEIYSKLFKARQIRFSYNNQLEIDLGKIEKKINKDIKMIIISNPNNPTGTIIEKKKLLQLIQKAQKFNIPFVIDEVYYGYTQETLINYINKFNNLIIIRTFSKSYGLAALRAGYIVSNNKIAQRLYKFKPMYEINSIAAKLINYILKNKKSEEQNLLEFKKGKEYLVFCLKKMKVKFIDTYTNFVHIKTKNKKTSKTLSKYLYKNNILIRSGGPGLKGFENYIRVTIGDKKQMSFLVHHLKKKWSYLK